MLRLAITIPKQGALSFAAIAWELLYSPYGRPGFGHHETNSVNSRVFIPYAAGKALSYGCKAQSCLLQY
jgi:hypothetical protein